MKKQIAEVASEFRLNMISILRNSTLLVKSRDKLNLNFNIYMNKADILSSHLQVKKGLDAKNRKLLA